MSPAINVQTAFVEIETPLLFRKTSEGAAEFPVPFTDSSGNVWEYSLPQSPQQVFFTDRANLFLIVLLV